jgi:hypothetical protein
MAITITPVVLTPVTQLGTVAATMATGVPAGVSVVTRAVASNVGTVGATINLWLIPSGGSKAATNEIVAGRTLAVGATDLLPELAGAVLASGDIVQASAGTAATLNFFASGYTVVGS